MTAQPQGSSQNSISRGNVVSVTSEAFSAAAPGLYHAFLVMGLIVGLPVLLATFLKSGENPVDSDTLFTARPAITSAAFKLVF